MISSLQASALTASAWLAGEAPAPVTNPGTDWVSYLLNGGPFAIVLLLILLDKLGTHSERDRLRVEVDAKDKQIEVLHETIRTQIVPPLTEQNRLMVDIAKILDDEERFPARPRRRST